jgi:hypothetical protein
LFDTLTKDRCLAKNAVFAYSVFEIDVNDSPAMTYSGIQSWLTPCGGRGIDGLS